MSLNGLFAWPEALPILLLVPLVWLVLRMLDQSRRNRLERGIGPRAHKLAMDLGRGQRRMRRWFIMVGFLLALIALLQPLWGEGLRRIPQQRIDILVCLDVSRSMLARDLPPTRLKRAQREIRVLTERMRGDRLGLVAFAGEARLIAPLTHDMDSYRELVEVASPLSILRGGTNLGAALETALEILGDPTGNHEVILLLTDGEDLEQRSADAVLQCKEKKIPVHCVGFGSVRGSKIAIQDEGSEKFLRDNSGQEIVSAMNSSSLRRIAESTGGTFMDATSQPLPLLELYKKRILPMARKSFGVEERRERKNRFQWPLLAAFLLWIMELCSTDRKRP